MCEGCVSMDWRKRDSELRGTEPQHIPSYGSKARRAFQSFRRWLKNESFHQRGLYCEDDVCRVCAAWREINRTQSTDEEDARDVLGRGLERDAAAAVLGREAVWRNYFQDHGFDQGREAAYAALIELAQAPAKCVGTPQTEDEKIAFGRAIRQGFLEAVRRCLPSL